MNARTLRRVRAGLSESDAYWLRELHAAPIAVQASVARLMNRVGETLWLQGVDIDNPQHVDARTALMGTLHRFFVITREQGPQHVLKAERDGADATDRGTPALRSPGGGPMGAGQAAAAAPSRESQQ